MVRPLCLFLLATLCVSHQIFAERLRMQYFYDEDRSSLSINDLKFPSPQRGIAAGVITEKEKVKPVAVVTSDGGAHWSLVPLKEPPISMFFLSEKLGWMVTTKGLWRTEEAGRSWQKLPKAPSGMLRVWFLDELHGWAVGLHKSVHQTDDGGKHWTAVEAAGQPKSDPELTTYSWIYFATPQVGIITGWRRVFRRDDPALPDWVDPEKAVRRERPQLSVTLETRDGGKNWVPSTGSLFGRITRVLINPAGAGLALLEFDNAFDYPSEVHRLDWKNGRSTRVYREKNRAITDIALLTSGSAYLAGAETAGKLLHSPVPGKLKLIRSNDLSHWTELEVDYRAVASRAFLATAGEQAIWVATDTGMILKLAP